MFYDLDLERSVLGAIIMHPEWRGLLNPDILYWERHKTIYKQIHAMATEDGTVSLPTLSSELKAKGVDHAYTGSLLNDIIPSEATFEQAIKKLEEYREKRDLWLATAEMREHIKKDEFNEITELLTKVRGGGRADKARLSAEDIVGAFGEYRRRGGGIHLGVPSFDNLTDGIAEGEVCYLLGRAKVIKSIFMQNVVSSFARRYQDDGAIVFSLEMSAPQLGERMLMIESGKDKEEILSLPQEERNGIINRQKNIFYVTKSAMSMGDIYTTISSIRYLTNIRLIIIDFLTRIKCTEKSEYDALRAMTKFIKDMAKELNVAIFVLTQVSRAEGGDGFSPLRLSSGRGSGTIEEDADFVLGAYRPELNPHLGDIDRRRLDGVVYLQMLGARRTPIIEKIKLHFNKKNLRLHEEAI